MTTDHRTFIVADWLEDDRPGAPSRQPPAFEGILTGYWNGFAEWKTNRRVIEQFIRLQAAHADTLGFDDWRFGGDTLVVTAPDYPDEPTFIEPEGGLYDISLGYIWATYDQYDVDADLSNYTLYRMEART